MPILVNKLEITDDQIHAEMQHHPAGSVDEARYKASRALVIEQLLKQEAVNKELTGDDAVDELIKQEVRVPEADAASCSLYYENNKQRFTDKSSGKLLPLSMVESKIRDYLHTRSLQMGISQYIKVLAGKANIAGFDLEE